MKLWGRLGVAIMALLSGGLAAPAAAVDYGWDGSFCLVAEDDEEGDERSLTVDFDWASDSQPPKGTRRFHPRLHDGEIQFRYRDYDYDQVYVSGSFNGWWSQPMSLDKRRDIWTLSVELEEGRHFYQFIVEDAGDSWSAIDPDNPDAERDPEHGWVSRLFVEEDGDVRRHATRRRAPLAAEFAREFFPDALGEEEDDCGILYQRVDGLMLRTTPLYSSQRRFEPSAGGRIGYGFKSKRWSAGLCVLQPLSPGNQLLLKASAYAGTDYTDQTGIGTGENTLAAIIFCEDFRDYYRREGAAISLIARAGRRDPWLRIEGGVRAADYFALENKANWSFGWGGRERFAPNPAIDEGTLRSVFGNLRIGDDLHFIAAAYERCGEELFGGAYEFSQITGLYRARLRMGRRRYVDLRLKAGTCLSGDLPLQRRYHLGGLGTVRGYRYQSLLAAEDEGAFGGQRMALANLEYAFRVDGDLDLVLFFDSGMAWEDRDANMDLDQWKSSAGVGVQLDDGDLRLNLIRRLDDQNDEFIVQARLQRMF